MLAWVHQVIAAEQEFLSLAPEYHVTVLNLSGLWGGQRAVKHWVGRVAPTKEALKNKVRFPSVSQAPKIGVEFQVHKS